MWIGFNLLVSLVIELDRPLCGVVGSDLLLFLALLLVGELLRAFAVRRKVDVLRTPHHSTVRGITQF